MDSRALPGWPERSEKHDPACHPPLSELDLFGQRDVLDPAGVAQSVAASVMRRLARIEKRQIGSVPTEIRDAIEHELRAALRCLDRWCGQCCPRGRVDRG